MPDYIFEYVRNSDWAVVRDHDGNFYGLWISKKYVRSLRPWYEQVQITKDIIESCLIQSNISPDDVFRDIYIKVRINKYQIKMKRVNWKPGYLIFFKS